MLRVVPAQEKYAASYHACLDRVSREKRYLAQIEAPPLEQIQGFLKDNVANDAIQFFALDDEAVVGWADIFPAWAHALSHCGLLGMGVHPDYRGHGLGARLLAACIDKAWTKGLTRIELKARVDNKAAIALYEKFGFEHEATKTKAMRFDESYFDAVQMRLLRDESMGSQASIATMLEMLEREIHTESARNKSRTAELLAEDFIEFGRSGRSYGKVEVLEALDSRPVEFITSSEFKLNLLSPTVALLTYKSQRNSNPDSCTLRSSIWRKQGSTWKIVFHQGTPTTGQP